jgi:DNA (cytosine-5)-methyltransferase 1
MRIGELFAGYGGPAPAPTEPGPAGPRLATTFGEWMMGLPQGWVTDVPDLTRTEALRAIGNGVVPQQATAALRLMFGEGLKQQLGRVG